MQMTRYAISALLITTASAANAQDLVIYSGMGMKSILDASAELFEESTGFDIQLEYGTAGLMAGRVADGEEPDIIVVQRSLIEELIADGFVTSEDTTGVSSSPIGLVGRNGTADEDISSTERLKEVLLAAETIGFTDPAAGGLSGGHFGQVVQDLGIESEIYSKATLGKPMANVQNGSVEYAVLQVSEIMTLENVNFIGEFPVELQVDNPITAAIVSSSERRDIANLFLEHLSSESVQSIITDNGMEIYP